MPEQPSPIAHSAADRPSHIVATEVTVLSKFRREAALLAAYLSQFENTDTDDSEHLPAAGVTPESQAQTHADYRQACQWLATTKCTDDDIAALARLRRQYGFPT
ncbi:hypothetical protein [Rhodococcus qingshengii]|uniref:hypothetical protein n=1 Tax=Rhodococcus qingshengii TaxID=334542 RepID=UPI0024BAD60B|nr:hypothetical protein [Rhodococcus qingshengii]MDJ0441440.1 hypothetical protein [Rhodococcus qingshengii]